MSDPSVESDVDLLRHIANIKSAIGEILVVNGPALGEYELIQRLQQQDAFVSVVPTSVTAGAGTLILFKKHFLTMHCLYALQNDYTQRGLVLDVSALRVALSMDATITGETASAMPGESLRAEQVLKDFYADLEYFKAATQENVDELLRQFWQAYAKRGDAEQNLKTLELPANATWPDIQHAYRRLAQQSHPDKGGDAQTFAALSAAYNQLKARFSKG